MALGSTPGIPKAQDARMVVVGASQPVQMLHTDILHAHLVTFNRAQRRTQPYSATSCLCLKHRASRAVLTRLAEICMTKTLQ